MFIEWLSTGLCARQWDYNQENNPGPTLGLVKEIGQQKHTIIIYWGENYSGP